MLRPLSIIAVGYRLHGAVSARHGVRGARVRGVRKFGHTTSNTGGALATGIYRGTSMARNSLRARIEALEKRRGFGMPRPRPIVMRFMKSDGQGNPAGYGSRGFVLQVGRPQREVCVAEDGGLVNDPPKGGGE